MDPFSIVIILSIGNVVAWLAALYVKDAARGLIGHVVVATTGAFIAGYLALWLFPNLYAFGMMTGAFGEPDLYLRSAEFRALGDTCLNCKRCAFECPSQVDEPSALLLARRYVVE